MLIIFRIIYMTKNSIFTIGGTVQAGSGIYLTRQADEDLLAGCLRGAFTYVLTPRQMGKSSLMVATADRLRSQGVRCVIIDLTQIGVQGTTAEQWYLGLLVLIEDQLGLNTDAMQWWQRYSHLSFTQRLTQFFQTVLLVEVQEPVTIFVDEIDSTLSLDFTDDFFAAIRYFFVARAQEVALQRLSFVLIGVATPGDLIRDPERTPFNIGQRVDLTDFTLAESSPLMDGLQEELGLSAPQAKKIMKEVWYWTEGHPYLTQKLCAALVEAGREMDVEHVMRQMFFGQKSNQDNNLQFVRDMLTRRSPNLGEVLRAYREIQRGKSVLDDEQLLVYSHLKLCGVVRRQNNKLVVRNRIYSKVFDRQWIRENLSENFWQRYWPVLKWAIPTATLAGVTMAMVVFLHEAQRQTQEAQRRNIEQLSTAASNDLASDNHIDAAIKVLAAYGISKISNIPMSSYTHDTLSKVILGIKEINQIPHGFGVSAIAFSKDGKFIASGDRGRNIRIWNARTGEKKLDLIDEGKARKNTAIYSIAFSHDGKKIVSGSIDKEIQLWSTETGEQIGKTLTGHKNEVFSVAFSHDDKTIVSGSLDKEILLWDVEKKKLKKTISGHRETVFSVAFSPDDQTIVSGSWDRTVRLWNAKSGEPIGKPMKHDSRVYSVAFSPNGKKIVSASKDKKIRLWNTNTQKIEGKPFGDHTSIIYTVAFSSDGKKIVSGSWDNKVKLWDAEKKVKIGHPFVHNNIVYRVAFSPDNNKTVISGSLDKTLRIWNIEPDKPPYKFKKLENHKDGIHPIVFSPNGNVIASGGWAKTIKLHSLIGKKTIDIDTGRTIYSIAFSPDSQTIVSGGDNGKLRLWDVATGKEKTEIIFKNNHSSDAHSDAIYGVAFSPDGETIASGSWDRTLKLWDAKSGAFKKVLRGHKGLVYGIAFSHDGKKIVSGSGDKTLQLWGVADGEPIGKPLTGHEDNVHSVAFSLDDKEIVSGSLDQTIRFWDAVTGKQQGKTIDSHKSVVYRVAYSPDGKKVISSSRDGVIRLWDAQTKEQIGHPFREHKDAVYSVAFSPDGKTIVSGSEDSSGDLLLWKLPDDKKLNLQLTLCQKLANHSLLKDPQTDNAKAAKKYCDEIIAKK
jgi:WD40 repeat protein